ncbi:MAG: 30S ribosomal protein S12 methylthiotransferase RimO [Candidatus Omnitrophica bacterium]|nr:30S ribosomal protein S12 methylthiotransferase RimO [Candidatus Omnitrophota bacterium]MBD3269269.1 30S ribosomal protein S12 methylthiotransferase RimO [Candidatus Omnitrophota bacterium]
MGSNNKFSIVSLGCFRNTYDSEIVAQRFEDRGYKFVPLWKKEASVSKKAPLDILIVNTCGFIDKAKKESIDIIREAIDYKKEKKTRNLYVFGCLVQRYKKQLARAFPEVDQWWGVEQLNASNSVHRDISPSWSYFLKICEGCLNRCSYCAIPLIKGGLRSKPVKDILTEVRMADKNGTKELNIIGQDITSWGKDFRPQKNLTGLLENILKETSNIKWVRLIYTHPRHITDSLIELIATNKKVCKYIDLPIQHINDRLLKKMNRKVTKSQIKRLIKKIRKIMPSSVIRSSVITGFPGETEDDFRELLDFLKEVKFDKLGVFTYSREENTPAYNFGSQVHHQTKKRRFSRIMELQQKISAESLIKFLGKDLQVLIEERKEDIFIGRSEYDAPEVDGLVFLRKKGLRPGDFYRAKVVGAYDYDLLAE